MSNKQELTALTKARTLAKETYQFCNTYLPEHEKFGLWSQMTRCAVSVASNIAEGQQRGDKEFIQFIKIARGSLAELRIQLEICNEIGYCGVGETMTLEALIEELGKITYGLMLRLKADAGV